MKKNRGRSPYNRRSYRERDNSPNHHDSRHNPRDARRNINQNRYGSRASPVRSPVYSPPLESNRGRKNYRDADDFYTMLLVRNFSSKLDRDDIQDSLEHEFQKFGDVTIKVTRDHTGERVAYATFRNPEDARDCKNAKGHLVMYDRRLSISVANDEPPEDRHFTREMSPYGRDQGYSPGRGRSPPMARSPPRRRSPKRMQGRQRNYQPRDRPNYNDRYSPRPRPAGRDKRQSDGGSPVRERYSSRDRDSSGDRSPTRRRSSSKDGSAMSTNGAQSNSRHRSTSKGSSPSKKPVESFTDSNPPAPSNNSMPPGPGFAEPNMFPQPGFMDKTIPPEDDPFATRTLFVGNLELDVSAYEIRRIFAEFGTIEDVDVKRSSRGQGAYCFIKFSNLNQAYKAKVSLNGKMILKNIARIGYGKVMMSPKIWVGGLGDWTTMAHLEREFDRFGAIRKIDFRRGNDSAIILYETIDAAQAACSQMRGFLMPDAETRLRMDFLDPDQNMQGYDGGFQDWGRHENSGPTHGQPSNDRYSNNKYKSNSSRYRGRNVFVEDRKAERRGRSRSPRSKHKDGKHKSSIHEAAMTELQLKRYHAKSCFTLHDLCQIFDPPCWQGGFVLKKIAFPVLFFLLDGDMGVFNRTTADPNSPTGRQTMFHVNQRLRMTEDNVKEVNRRMKYCEGKCCLMVCVPGVPENLNMSGTISGPMPTQHKPLRGLVKYFKEKEAAAIISVPLITLNKDKEDEKETKKEVSGFIHAFPPSSFTSEQLLKIGPSLQPQFFADDYLFAILVKGQTSVLL